MKIFITGGSGLIGSKLAKELIERNHNVTILTRNIEKSKKILNLNVDFIEGDPRVESEWMDKIKDYEIIVNLVGENIISKRWTDKQKQKIESSRILSGENIQKAIHKSGIRPKAVISVSGTDYYPIDKSDKIYSESDLPSNSFLGKLCQNWEKPIIHLKDDNIRVVIFRIGLIFSKTGKRGEVMFLPHKLFIGGKIGSGKQIYSFIHEDDVVNLLTWAIEKDDVSGIYNAVTPQIVSMSEVAKVGGKILHRPTWTWLPGFILKIIMGERSIVLLNGRKVSSQKVINAGYEFKFPTIQKTLEDILH